MRWAPRIAVAASILTLMVVAFVAWRVSQAQWAPLGPFPEQRVLSDRIVDWRGETYSDSTVQIPAVSVAGEVVRVEGTKCATETVEVRGSKSWITLDPRGVVDQRGVDALAARPEGCRTATFDNPIPQQIRDYALGEFSRGRAFVVAQISGCETPQRQSGDGVTLCWRTEPFALVP